MHGVGWIGALLGCLAAAVSTVTAQNPDPQQLSQNLKKLSIEELTELDITTASRRTEPLAQTPYAVSVIRGEDIRRAGSMNLAEALRLADGVAVARADNETWEIGRASCRERGEEE